MIRGIDHIVIAGPDLDSLTATFRSLGFNVVGGGKHPIGSYNNLIGLADGAYIELLSFYEDSPNHYWWDAVHSRGGGLIDFCMQTDDIRGDYALFQAQGVAMSPLVGLSRVRVDGYQLAWLNNEIYGEYQGLIPFVIEDETPRDERVPKEKAARQRGHRHRYDHAGGARFGAGAAHHGRRPAAARRTGAG